MGCFSTCFGNSKRPRRSRRRPIKASPSLLDHLQKYESVEDFKVAHLIEEEKVENPIEESKVLVELNSEEKKEKANVSERKKVTFDLNVKVYEPEENEGGGLLDGEIKEEFERKKEENGPNGSDSSSSSLFSYPSNHRYQNCRDSDDEFDGLVSSDESDLDDLTDDEDEDDYDCEEEVEEEVDSEVKHGKEVMGNNQEQSSESLFSLNLESRLQNEDQNKEVNSPMPIKNQSSKPNPEFDRSKYVDSVLNPVENVTQWKVIKAKSRRAAREDREAKENNIDDDGGERNSGFVVRKEEKEIGVDTSLSTWLGGPKTQTPNSKSNSVSSVGNSVGSVTPNKFEDRPILGALTMDEIRQFSATSSPRKSPGWSPDDKPIIGSVGSYWSHTGQSTKSGSSTRTTNFAESAKVIWNPMPFETRLEKALEEEGNAEYTLKSVKSAPL